MKRIPDASRRVAWTTAIIAAFLLFALVEVLASLA